MPVLHVTSSRARTPDKMLASLAADVATALGVKTGHVFAHRIDAQLVDGSGGEATWTAVTIQGNDYGADAERSAIDVIKNAWPDRQVSVALLRDTTSSEVRSAPGSGD